MKIHQSLKFISLLLFIAAGIFIFRPADGFAATRTWTGSGGDSNLATAGNWQGGAVPQNGDTIVLPSAGGVIDISNNLPSSVVIDGIVGGSSVWMGGDKLRIKGNIGPVTFTNPVTIEDNIVATGTYLGFRGAVDGSGNITQNHSGSDSAELRLIGDNRSYHGSIVTTNSFLQISHARSLGSTSGPTTVSGGGLVFCGFTAAANITENLNLSNAAIHTTDFPCATGAAGRNRRPTYQITLSGSVTVAGNMSFRGDIDLNIQGPFTGSIATMAIHEGNSAALIYQGQAYRGKQKLISITSESDCSEFTGYTDNKKYVLDNTTCDVRVELAGQLSGVGALGELLVYSGGVLAPGNSPGVISLASLEFEENGVYEFEIAGNDNGQFDQIKVSGDVALGNGTLRVILLDGFIPQQGKSFIIISNEGVGAIQGIFAGLPEGAAVEVDGTPRFTISYVGGDGNDVVLTAIPGVGDAGEATEYGVSLTHVMAVAGFTVLAGAVFAKRYFSRA